MPEPTVTTKTALKPAANAAVATVGKNYFIYINTGTGEDVGAQWTKLGALQAS